MPDRTEWLRRIAAQRGWSLGRVALAHEAQLLGLSEAEMTAEMPRRYEIIVQLVERGLAVDFNLAIRGTLAAEVAAC